MLFFLARHSYRRIVVLARLVIAFRSVTVWLASESGYPSAAAAVSYEIVFRVLAHVYKVVRRLAQLTRRRFAEGDDLHLYSVRIFKVLDQRNEISVAGRQNNGVQLLRHRYCVYRHADVPVGLFCAAGKDADVLDPCLNTEFVERLEKSLLVLALRPYNVSHGAYQGAACKRLLYHLSEVHLRFVKIFCAVIKVLRVYKNADALAFVLDYSHTKNNLVFKK